MRTLLVALLLATALLAGCTGTTDDSPSSTSSAATTTKATTPATTSTTTAASTTTAGTTSSSGTTSGTTTTSTSATNSTAGNSTTNGPPAAVSQECTIGANSFGNALDPCQVPDLVSSTGASFTKGTATFTYTGQGLPTLTLKITDADGNEVASGTGASPITINLDGKVPAGAVVKLTGACSASVFAGFTGTLKVDLS